MTDVHMNNESGVLRTVANRFVLQRRLGKGGAGRVYQAHDLARDAMVAVKFLRSLDPASLFRFKSEFRTLANLSHPNLLQLYELVAYEDVWLLTMELVEGMDFLSFVRPPQGPLPLQADSSRAIAPSWWARSPTCRRSRRKDARSRPPPIGTQWA